MGTWLVLAGVNLLALGGGVAFGPVYAAAGRLRTWTLRVAFLAAVALEFAHVPAVAWFLVLWASFGIGGRIRRRLENPEPDPLTEEDLEADVMRHPHALHEAEPEAPGSPIAGDRTR